jgi:hypothetical protein
MQEAIQQLTQYSNASAMWDNVERIARACGLAHTSGRVSDDLCEELVSKALQAKA